MAIQIADGFQLRVAKPLDDRQNVETVAQLDPTYGYEGQIVYVKDIKQFYTCYKDENGSLAYKVMETGSSYTLPIATDTVLGGVKVDGVTITVDAEGVITGDTYTRTEIDDALALKIDKPEVDGTAGQILVLQDDGSLAYADNVTEFDDTEIQEELDTKLDKEKVVQNLDAPDVESVLSTEALNTVLNNKLDKSDGSSLVPDTEIAKIHEHVNQDVLDKLSDDGNGNLLYDSNLISVNEMMTVIELNNFLDTLEIDGVGYVPSTTP